MKKNIITALLCTIAFGLGMGVNNFAMSGTNNIKIACIDINRLALSSNTVRQAQATRDKQTKDMLQWYDRASADIQKQESQEAQKALVKKYENQLTQKQKLIKEQYSKEIKRADSQMENVISQKSKELGYNLVFKKDALLFGGDDITSEILPLVK